MSFVDINECSDNNGGCDQICTCVVCCLQTSMNAVTTMEDVTRSVPMKWAPTSVAVTVALPSPVTDILVMVFMALITIIFAILIFYTNGTSNF